MIPDELAPLRVSAVLIGWCGVSALVAAQLLSPAAGLAAGVVIALVALSCSMYRSTAARQVRRQISFATLAGALTYVAFHLSGAHSAAGLARTLPPLLIGVLTAQGLGADKRHDLLVSVTIGEFMIVLAAGVAPRPWLALPLLAGWILAVVALAQSHRLHAADCSAPGLRAASPAPRPPRGPAAAAAAIAVAIGLLLFLVLPQPSQSAAQRRLQGAVGSAPTSEGGGRSAGHYSRGALDMRTRGKLPTEPVAQVPADSPQLWRSRVYDNYDGTSWLADEGPLRPLGTGRITLPADPLDEGVVPAGSRRTDDVRTFVGFDGLVIAPGTPVALTTAGRAARVGAARLLVEDPGGFAVTSVLAQTDPETLAGAAGTDPSGRWLQLPAALPDRVGGLARQIAGVAPTRPAAVAAITAWLAANKTYDLNSPVPPAGADAVDDFLFRVDTGFCEQFAAAEVVLLRTLDIPARMATGFGYGTDSGGLRLFTGSNAHAWVEVFYPGVGWSPSDPTPPSVQVAAKPRVSAFKRFLKWVARLLSTTSGRLTLAAVIAALGAIAFWATWWRRRRRADTSHVAPAALAGALLTAFARLEAALVADGRPRAPGETLSELERRLGADAAGRRALAAFELACYSPHLLPPEAARAAAHAFEVLASSILAAHAARGQLADSIGVRR